MLAIVVNEMVRGGWLEWLTRVKMTEDGKFDGAKEQKRLGQGSKAQEVLEEMAVSGTTNTPKEQDGATSVKDGVKQKQQSQELAAETASYKRAKSVGRKISSVFTRTRKPSRNSTTAVEAAEAAKGNRKAAIVQSVWDTTGNTVEAGVGELIFMPYDEEAETEAGKDKM